MTETTAARETRARRGDLVIIEFRRSYTEASYKRVEQPSEYRIMKVTNLFRDGRIKAVCEVRYGGNGYAQPLDRLLHATGERWLLPAADWDTAEALRIVRGHTYPNSTMPRDFPSLEAAREALAPARRSPAPEDEPDQFRVAILRKGRDAEHRTCVDETAVQAVVDELLAEARVGMTDDDRVGVARLVAKGCAMALSEGFVGLELVGSRMAIRPAREQD